MFLFNISVADNLPIKLKLLPFFRFFQKLNIFLRTFLFEVTFRHLSSGNRQKLMARFIVETLKTNLPKHSQWIGPPVRYCAADRKFTELALKY